MFTRQTSLAAALFKATEKEVLAGKVDHKRGNGHWVARRICIDAEQERHLGFVTEYDHTPKRKETAR